MSAIRDYAEQHDCGLLEAKRAVAKINKIEKLQSLRTSAQFSSCGYILTGIIDHLIAEVETQ